MSEHIDDGDVHDWFSLTYANYLVMPRAVLQSMPLEWQARFVKCLLEMEKSFGGLDWPAYDVRALKRAPVLIDEECGECEGVGEIANPSDEEVMIECPSCDGLGVTDESRYETPDEVGFRSDPIPHYNRGRTRLTPAI